MVSAAVTSAASAQLFRQAEGLKAHISGKYAETTDHFSEEFVQRKSLQDIYKTILLSDLQYALDRKVELELWNNAFKGHIDYLRQCLKEKRGSEKAELQAKLCFFIDASVGFYLQLLQEFCDCYGLDLPFRTKAINLGILPDRVISECKPAHQSKPKASSPYYISQDCLVHLGDLARYRNDVVQAESYYKLASSIIAVNGQPYNQLAIIESAKGDQLKAVFYYCKSALVQNPFPAAVSNLQKTLNQYCTRQSLGILSKTNCSTVDELIALFLQFHGSIYLMLNIDKLGSLQERIITDFEALNEELTNDQLLSIAIITVFSLYKNKPKEEDEQEECIAEDEIEVWNLITSFATSLYCLMIKLADLHEKDDGRQKENKFLPSVKIFSDWILCSGSSILLEEAFDRNKQLYKRLTFLGNELLKTAAAISSPTASALPEDLEVRGFFPLRRIHRRLNFKYNERDDDNASYLRAYRIVSFVNWLCQQEPASKYIAKGETGGSARFFYLQEDPNDEKQPIEELKMSEKDFDIAVRKLFDTLPDLQGKPHSARSKSPFRETRSLFRTDSEEQGIKEVPEVSGPVASYSLFDSTWSVPFNRSPTKESPAEDQGYPELFEKLALARESSPQTTKFVENHTDTITTSELFPKSTRSVNIGVFPSSVTPSNAQTRNSQPKRESRSVPVSPMASQVPNHPIQQQLSRMPMASPHMPPASFYSNPHAPNRVPARMEVPLLRPTPAPINNPGPTMAMNQHPLSFVGPVPRVQIPVQQGIPHPANFQGFVPPVVTNGAVFGAIGQTPRSQCQNHPTQIHQQPQNAMNFTPPGSPCVARNVNPGNQSIWSSNYGFGHGAMSPLEQLLSDQKKSQPPMMQHKPMK